MTMVQLYYNYCKRQLCTLVPDKFHKLNVVVIVSNSPASMLQPHLFVPEGTAALNKLLQLFTFVN